MLFYTTDTVLTIKVHQLSLMLSSVSVLTTLIRFSSVHMLYATDSKLSRQIVVYLSPIQDTRITRTTHSYLISPTRITHSYHTHIAGKWRKLCITAVCLWMLYFHTFHQSPGHDVYFALCRTWFRSVLLITYTLGVSTLRTLCHIVNTTPEGLEAHRKLSSDLQCPIQSMLNSLVSRKESRKSYYWHCVPIYCRCVDSFCIWAMREKLRVSMR